MTTIETNVCPVCNGDCYLYCSFNESIEVCVNCDGIGVMDLYLDDESTEPQPKEVFTKLPVPFLSKT